MALGGCAQSREPSALVQDDAGADDGIIAAKIPEALRRDLEHGRARDVIVELIDREELSDAGVATDAAVDGAVTDLAPLARSVRDDEDVSAKAERYHQMQEQVLEQAASDSAVLRFQYVNMPLLHMRIADMPGLLAFARLPEVVRVHEDVQFEHQLAESLPMISQPAAAAAGQLGAGTAVAVLDTGCDFTRAAFGSCASAGAANCKVVYARDFGTSDNVLDTNNHGTNVSGIVLGVAPSTKILALDVFETNMANGSTILQAVDWVITNRAQYNIVAMNMSLGGGGSTTVCSSDYFATGIANARSAGILSAIASGNNGFNTQISSPACVPAAISVGAVYDGNFGGVSWSSCTDSSSAADKVTCFSNSASFLSMLAPGSQILAAGVPMSGTSQATPHVAGAIAVLRAAFPSEPISSTVSRLTTTGPTITDAKSGVAVHRLDLNAALGGAGTVDVTPPTGTVLINGGVANTKVVSVTLTMSASDDGGAVSVCVSNTASCTTFAPFTASKAWKLTAGDGVKTVYVVLRDATGNKTTLTPTIRLDAAAPTGSTLTATPGNAQVALSWTPASDAGSGVTGYRVQAATNTTTPPSCTAGTMVYTGSATSFTHMGLTNGTPYAYRVCPSDGAGNVGLGPTATARPAPEFTGPTGTVSINQGAVYANKTAVTLTLTSADPSGVASMCISNTTTCTAFVANAPTKTWSLAPANGTSTVRVWFKDIYGNVSASPASDTIILDTGLPTTSTISAVAGNASVALSWTMSSDQNSGLAGYRVVSALNTAPTCAAGTVVYTGTALSTTHSNLSNGSVYVYRVCPLDNANNVTTGGTVTSRPAPEFDGPVGTVVINQGAQYTNSRGVTLTVSASDANQVTGMCISNTTTCTSFSTFSTTKAWTLAASSGTATVRVWFRDNFGNVSAAATSDTINVDLSVPKSSTLTVLVTSGAAALLWTASSDVGSGLAGYRVRMAPNTPPSCTTGVEVYSGMGTSFIHNGLSNGSVYGYRVCPFDVAGNSAAGTTVIARPQ